MIWETMRFILHLQRTIWKQRIKNMKKWDVSATKIRKWEFILSTILMDIGWRLYRRNRKLKVRFK